MKLDHIAINVKNIQESIDWYTEKLSARVTYVDKTWAMLDCAGTKVALTISDQHPPHFAFAVDDIAKLPGEVKYHRDGSAYVYTKDPDGNTIEYVYWPK